MSITGKLFLLTIISTVFVMPLTFARRDSHLVSVRTAKLLDIMDTYSLHQLILSTSGMLNVLAALVIRNTVLKRSSNTPKRNAERLMILYDYDPTDGKISVFELTKFLMDEGDTEYEAFVTANQFTDLFDRNGDRHLNRDELIEGLSI